MCVILSSHGATVVPRHFHLNGAGSAMLQIYSSPPLCLFSRTSSGISSSVIFIRGEEQRWKPAAASGQDLSNPVIQPSQQTKIWEVWAHQETWTIWADPDLPGGEEGIPHSPNTFSCDFFLKWVFFPLFFQWKQLFLESRLKGPLFVTDNSETQCSCKSLQPCWQKSHCQQLGPLGLPVLQNKYHHSSHRACVKSKYTTGTAQGVFLF